MKNSSCRINVSTELAVYLRSYEMFVVHHFLDTQERFHDFETLLSKVEIDFAHKG